MKKNPLLGALPLIAKTVGDHLGVRVVIGQTRRAETDGDVIYLPPLPAEDAPLVALCNGYIDHEAAHVRFTDFGLLEPGGWTGRMANVLEDIRVERALVARYPGCRDNLAALVEALERESASVPPPEAPLADQVLAAVHALLRARLLGQAALADGARALEARLEAALPPGAVVKLLALAFEVRRAGSTADAIALSRRIVAMLEAETRPPDGPGADAPPPPARGNPPVATAPGAGAGPDGSGPSPDPTPDGPDGAAAPGPGAPPDAANRRAALAAMLAGADGACGGAAFEGVGERAKALVGDRAAGCGAACGGLAEYGDPPPDRGDAAAAAAAAAAARAATAALRRRLGTLVQASVEDDRRSGRRGRRLDTGSLHRPCAGQPVRFCAREARDAPKTAVGLLLDRSGSMGGRMALAGQAVLATALALETVPDVACWAAAFPGANRGGVIPLKPFAARASRVAGRFGLGAGGGTPLAEALWRAAYELLRRPEPRRLVIVATDGLPDDPDRVRDAIGRCRAGGIEVLGLGIGQNLAEVEGVFGARSASAIGVIEGLAPALFALLERHLTRA